MISAILRAHADTHPANPALHPLRVRRFAVELPGTRSPRAMLLERAVATWLKEQLP